MSMLYELDPTRLSNTKNSKSVKHVFQTENDNQCLCHISLNFANEEVTELPKPLPATIPESPLYPLVKPYLLFMQVWGLFFSMGPNDQRVNFWRLYCGFGVLIQLSTTVFYVLPFYLTMEFESFTVNMLITCLWTVQNGITAYTVYSMCSDESKLKLFFTLWTTLVSCKVESDEISKYIISRRNIILSSCVIFNIIFSTGWIIINSGYIVDSFPSVLSEYFSPETINFMRILFCVTHFYSSAAWSLPAGFFILVSLTLHKLLTTYNQIIRNSVERILHESNVIGSIDPFNAEAFRFKHQQILKLLEVSNDMFGIFVLSIILSSMALLCFSTYMLLFMCATSFSKSLEASWAIISTIWLVLVSVTGSMINSEAHVPYDDLHAVPLAFMSPANMIKLLIFLNRVGGNEIGVSAWGFSILSKGFLSTLAGMFLSYFFLLVQFQSPTGLTGCGRNTTEILEADISNDV